MSLRPMAVVLLLAVASEPCLAQSATPGSTIVLDPIVVETSREPAQPADPAVLGFARASTSTPAPATPAAQQEDIVRQRLNALPGGVALVPQQDYSNQGNPTLSNALTGVPGVVVQSLLGGNDQPRIQMRGSAQQSPAERGVLVLQNGLPINRADGSTIVAFANPGQAETIEIYRGYMANRLGATVLSGAINFVSPTGSSQPGTQLSVSGGSFGQINTSGQVGGKKDNVDALLQFDTTRRDGFRNFNSSERTSVSGNVGVALSENCQNPLLHGLHRLRLRYHRPVEQEPALRQPAAGRARADSGRRCCDQSGSQFVRDKPRREASQFMVGNRTTATVDAHLFDIALGYTYTDDMFKFPIASGVRTTQGGDFTGLIRYAYNPASALLPLFETTAQYTVGSADRGYYLNQSGQTGAQFGANELNAQTLSLYAGANVPVWQQFVLSPSISYAYATRDNDDVYGVARRPTIAYSPASPTTLLANGSVPTQDTSYSRRYSGWSPSLALSYRPDALQTFFVAGSHSFEPPTHDDLIATANGTSELEPGSSESGHPDWLTAAFTTSNLIAQTANTMEGGWRGRADRFSWDVVSYYSWVDNELLSLRDAAGAPIGSINADRTTHFGVELGAGVKLTERLSGRLAYTYQDFRFVDDPLRGNNRLGGTVPHLIYAQLQLQATDAWMMQGAVRWSVARVPVDNMNTLYADPYAVVDLRSEYKINKTFRVFGEITNLFDKTYAATSVVVDQARRRPGRVPARRRPRLLCRREGDVLI